MGRGKEKKIAEEYLKVSQIKDNNQVDRLGNSTVVVQDKDLTLLGVSRFGWDIALMPPEDLELRVIVWEVNDCPIDDPEGLTDIYITGNMSSYPGGISRKTDTHVRSEGYGSFNWRMIFGLKVDEYTEPGNYNLDI